MQAFVSHAVMLIWNLSDIYIVKCGVVMTCSVLHTPLVTYGKNSPPCSTFTAPYLCFYLKNEHEVK